MGIVITNHFDNVINEHKAKILELYDTPFTSFEYFASFFTEQTINVITIEDCGKTIHIIAFLVNKEQKEVVILNRLFYLQAKYMNLLCSQILVDFAYIKKIKFKHLNNLINDSHNLNFVCEQYNENFVVFLPETFEDYLGKLSSNMRQQSKRRIANLNRTFGKFEFYFYEKQNISDVVIRKIIGMNHQRMANKNIVSGIDNRYTENILNFIPQYGFISVLKINDIIVAGIITYRRNDKYFMQTISSDPHYDKFSVGHTCLFLTIKKCIELNGKEFHMLWGNNNYKKRFLGERHQLFSAIYFSSIVLKWKYMLFKKTLDNYYVKKIMRLCSLN